MKLAWFNLFFWSSFWCIENHTENRNSTTVDDLTNYIAAEKDNSNDSFYNYKNNNNSNCSNHRNP